ncbi:hypothetical protein ESY86_10070 [Subsaximicrobium wynnwilliamsii]|uniref:DUF5063 domain-containing protein n=1 Tax=Subsaximicrobium wynnwilliamsii TaxID=291179 RepID=A0A5C6ZHB7_9FLAO|nr:hypothetical protein [Subsaximicrobium wynnwilliamsii]TXD83357.1 hypothetical protein ESY87_10350 [Subsaximicrobium wynnwilliamsii]TXD89106.1 hypothetical protein ESY86_10070 [Subsaximicrobium wynnwilliamsii]TXE03381.1 hypothetical protein ESY88_08650 [Subsaximicrobium wynnwilliamsii]
MEELEHVPLYKKAKDIQNLVDSVVDVIMDSQLEYETEQEGQMIDDSLTYLGENSDLIPQKIALVHGEDIPYNEKMESACFIKNAAIEILTDLDHIELSGYKDIEYFDLLRNEIDDFRILFAEWVTTFDPWDYEIDRWGLFNPPGVKYDDYDPDDDLPFDIDDFFEDL